MGDGKFTRRTALMAGAVLTAGAVAGCGSDTVADGADAGTDAGVEDWMLAEIMKQTEDSARLLERAQKAAARTRGLRSGDPVFTPLVVSAEFSQGNAPGQTLMFNVPADADFWAYRLLLYPYCKVVDPVNGTPDEVVYRSTSFTGEGSSSGVMDPSIEYSDFNSMMDGTFAFIYQNKELQNIDTPASAAYCCNTGKWAPRPTINLQTVWAAASQTPGGLVFDIPKFIPRGHTFALRFTPTYLGIRTIVETITVDDSPVEIVRQHKYKIVAVLEGEKKVSAFR